MSDLRKLLDEATKGPWICYADTPSVEPQWHIITRANKLRVIANVHIEAGNNTDEANACLLTMAPDLAAALLKAEEALDDAIRIAARNEAGPDLDAARATLTEIRKLTGAK